MSMDKCNQQQLTEFLYVLFKKFLEGWTSKVSCYAGPVTSMDSKHHFGMNDSTGDSFAATGNGPREI